MGRCATAGEAIGAMSVCDDIIAVRDTNSQETRLDAFRSDRRRIGRRRSLRSPMRREKSQEDECLRT
eukprot:753915-Hanusia_phi.AAC.24